MTPRSILGLLALLSIASSSARAGTPAAVPLFQTSDRCFACHNGLTTAGGQDVSIGLDWRPSIMANSARDPYWQASVRRESLDHPESQAKIEDECASCHMPMARYHAKSRGELGQVFTHLAGPPGGEEHREALDGVSCSLCHQISAESLGTPQTFSGQFLLAAPLDESHRAEFGPFEIDAGLRRVMRSSSGGFEPTRADHIRDSALCASCHTLHTNALGPDGKTIGSFPEQTPYQEWLHSSFANERSCQSCHMPTLSEPVQISRVLGEPRQGLARHVFVAANAFMQRMLNRYRDDLAVAAQPAELAAAANRTVEYLQSSAARVSVDEGTLRDGRLQFGVHVENLGGHRLPTAYPSRRAWLHVLVTDGQGAKVFESGALQPDGAIQGNDNDADPTRFEPHYREIRSADQVQIYESILGDRAGHVTTGLLAAVGYLKDNRLLPRGFNKTTASPEIAVHGDALADPSFTGGGDDVVYSISSERSHGPFSVSVELVYQPIGYRWAHNLAPYDAPEPRRFVRYFESMQSETAVVLAHARAIILR
ncbi:MAG TPA: hypothetical protein VG994_02460 [Steroidobacteraceae bacterium]|nr:hypothetical protein [Steroidobacteraceae bacterium]